MENYNIVFLGGSITEGAGASNYENSFAYKVGNYIKNLYKDKNVNIFNSGVGGTGSQYGLFRLKKDVIDKSPDVVFIEFAVNDRIVDSKTAAITMEGIIGQLTKLSKIPTIIFLITPTGLVDACSSVHKRIAYYYNIPCIDIQDHVWRQIGDGQYWWQDISIDNLHPNEKGHKVYAEFIIQIVESNPDLLINKPTVKQKPISAYEFKNPYIASYEKAIFYGHWREENINMPRKMELAAVSDTIGDCLEFKFKGKYLGLTTLLSREGGILEVNIDEASAVLDLYSDMESYFTTVINIMDLPDIEHRLILRVSERKNPKSKGNKIVVGGFLVDEYE